MQFVCRLAFRMKRPRAHSRRTADPHHPDPEATPSSIVDEAAVLQVTPGCMCIGMHGPAIPLLKWVFTLEAIPSFIYASENGARVRVCVPRP